MLVQTLPTFLNQIFARICHVVAAYNRRSLLSSSMENYRYQLISKKNTHTFSKYKVTPSSVLHLTMDGLPNLNYGCA